MAKLNKCFKCILKNIGATILGVKPMEIMSVRLSSSDNLGWTNCKEKLLSIKEIEILELNDDPERKKVLFYHISSLEKNLSRPRVLNFLKELGYPEDYNLKAYINFLGTKLEKYKIGQNKFPHEIGIFLGYPFKDVLGFMGYNDLELTDKDEWKIYGEKDFSLRQRERFDKARESFEAKLKKIKTTDQLDKFIENV